MRKTSLGPHAVGILGGSFNPVHIGHVRLAEEVQRRCAFDPLLIIPTKCPPHKPPYEVSDEHRLALVRLAFESVPDTRVSTFELESEGPSYAIRTIENFTRQYAGRPIYFILGTDAFNDLPSWYAFPDVMEACSFVVVARAGWDSMDADSDRSKLSRRLAKLVAAGLLKPLDSNAGGEPSPFQRVFATRSGTRICILDVDLHEVSSTEVRLRLQLGENVTGLVPPNVERYLKSVGVYATGKT
ncbi:MAG: nicotinate (nicotinamide) nucleotide adenylyltransferase [Deltaproteobacteria bacterium]|nr:nicotinate (nicotinamide) nucleotide adenylyltransferase [Deltaproteobacteria bacterium]